MVKNYLFVAVRNFLRYRVSTFINLSGLAIALTCAIFIYLFIYQELTFDHVHAKKERIYKVIAVENNMTNNTTDYTVVQQYPLGPAMQEELPEVEAFVRLAVVDGKFVKVGDDVFEEKFVLADPGLFNIFSIPVLQGHPDHALDQPYKVAISQSAARKYFAQTNPIGESLAIRIGDAWEEYQVSAVFEDTPDNSSVRADFFLSVAEANVSKFYTPLNDPRYGLWDFSAFRTYILVHENASLTALEKKLPAFRSKYFPSDADVVAEWKKNKGEALSRGYYLQTLSEAHFNTDIYDFLSPASNPMYAYVLSAIGLSILLLAAINFTLLSMSRSHSRAKEIGVRKVVGARRRQLTGQFLSEAILTSFIALMFALIISSLTLPVFNELSQKELSLTALLKPLPLISLLLITIFTGLLAGTYPSWVLSGIPTLKVLHKNLKPGRQNSLIQVLLTSQFVLPMLFLIVTAVMIKQLQFMRNKDLGFKSEHILVIENNTDNQEQSFRHFKHLTQQRTDIRAITATSISFTKGKNTFYMTDRDDVAPKDVVVYSVKPNFFKVLAIDFSAGRSFDPLLSSDSTEAVIVNEALVKAFGWTDPIDKKLDGSRVIGVVKDFNYESLAQDIIPMAFYLHKDEKYLGHILVALQGDDISKSMAAIASLWKETSDLPYQYSFLEEDMQALYEEEARWTSILQWVSGLTVFVTCLGLIGIIGLEISNRTKEIGIRKVLGASVSSILVLLSGDFVKLIAIAFVLAAPVAYYFINQWLQSFAYRIEIQWWLFAVPGVLVLLIALLSVSGQTWKAARQNPVDSLRYE